jgi:Glycoside-hydrolase family GH114
MKRAALLLLAACSSQKAHSSDAAATDTAGDTAASGDASALLTLPPANVKADYQLGGAYTPPAGVMVVSRDRTEAPAAGLYNICYLNGFQVQPGEESTWDADLLLSNAQGQPVIDTAWNERLLDVRAGKRDRILAHVQTWMTGCQQAGYQAIEIDNLDSYTRSQSLMTADDAVAMMSLFSTAAHQLHMPIAQKNSADLVVRKAALGTDFAVAEECNHYTECDSYTAGYGDHVIVIEYARADFTTGCTAFPQLSIILRDRDLVTPSDAAYVYDGC